MISTLRAGLTQDCLLLGQIVLLVLRLIANRADSDEPGADEFKVGDDILHDCTIRGPCLAVFMISILMPIVESPSAGPKATFIIPTSIIGMLPPCQMQESRECHQVTAGIGE
jgi:hypothetical protein